MTLSGKMSPAVAAESPEWNDRPYLATPLRFAALPEADARVRSQDFLALERPENERPFLVIPVGYPADDATVPELSKKSFADVCEIV